MSTAKGTGKAVEWDKIPGNPITCQHCGKILQKSLQTSSIIYCPRCGYQSYTFLKDNIEIQMPARLLEAENADECVKKAITYMMKLRSAPVLDDYALFAEEDPA